MKKRGEFIDERIVYFLERKAHPMSTRELSISLKVSWHTIINHCLKLQMAGKIHGYKIGNVNTWSLKK